MSSMTWHLPLKYLANYTQIYSLFDLNILYCGLFKFILGRKIHKTGVRATTILIIVQKL
jgi:hypothetical protein